MLGRLRHHLIRVSIFLLIVALIAATVGCDYTPPPSKNLEIRDWYDLDDVRDNLDGNHKLMNDLHSTTDGYDELAGPTANGGRGWRPIGYGYWAGTQLLGEIFKGTFDGQGYEIRDLYVSDPDGCQAGLLGFVGEGGIIKNITVKNVAVTGCEIVDGLVRFDEDNVRSLIGAMWVAGGLVAYNGGTVSNCYAMGNVTGDSGVGGLIGYNEGAVNDSYSSGNVAGYQYVGGLVGSNAGTVRNCYCSGKVTGDEYVGGLVGSTIADSVVVYSYSTGNVTGNLQVGGLVGRNTGFVSDSFWDTETSGQATSDGGTGKNTTEMRDITTFSDAGWNIIAVGACGERNPAYIWNIVDDETYPFLNWEP
jgi:hypothetical protein